MRITLVLLPLMILLGCKKDPGEGGKAEIRGRLMEQRYNSNGQPTGSPYPLADERVYIIYGDSQFHDDDVRSGPDGQFRFTWLRKGQYTLYAISECPTCPGGTKGVYRAVRIGKNNELVNAGDILVENH